MCWWHDIDHKSIILELKDLWESSIIKKKKEENNKNNKTNESEVDQAVEM